MPIINSSLENYGHIVTYMLVKVEWQPYSDVFAAAFEVFPPRLTPDTSLLLGLEEPPLALTASENISTPLTVTRFLKISNTPPAVPSSS